MLTQLDIHIYSDDDDDVHEFQVMRPSIHQRRNEEVFKRLISVVCNQDQNGLTHQ